MKVVMEFEGIKMKGELDSNHYYHVSNSDIWEDGLPLEHRGKGYGRKLLLETVRKYGYALSGMNLEHVRTQSARNVWDSIMRLNAECGLPDGFFAFRCVDYHGVRDALAYLGKENRKAHIIIGSAVKSYIRCIDETYLDKVGIVAPLFQIGAYGVKLGVIRHAMLSEENGFGIGHSPRMALKEISIVCKDRNPEYQLNLSDHTLESFAVEAADPNIQILPPKADRVALQYNMGGDRLPEWVYDMEIEELDLTEFISLKVEAKRLKVKSLKILKSLDNFGTIRASSPFKVIEG